jgi:hypothetical protein
MSHNISRHKREEIARARESEHAEKFRAGPDHIRADGSALIEAWNARIAATQPMLASPLIGPAIAAGYPYLRAYCPGCRTERTIDLRRIGRHPFGAVTGLIPALSCSWCRPRSTVCENPRPGPDQGLIHGGR